MTTANQTQLPTAGRLNRRRALRGTGIAAAAIGLVACGRKTSGPAAGSRSGGGPSLPPKRGGTLTLSANYNFGFDPHVLPITDVGMLGLFYSTLIRTNPRTNELEPDLAARWESPSQTELIFTLAPNIRWQDKPPVGGRRLKIDDIIYSYQRVQTDDPKFLSKSYLSAAQKMEAVDDHTLKLTLKQPDVTQLGNLAISSMKILAPEVVQKADKLSTADVVVGTGAFVLQQSEINVGASLVRNPTYFKAGLPYVDRVELHAFQDFASEWSAFLAAQIDHRWVPGQDSKKFADEQKDRYVLGWFPDQSYPITQAMLRKKPWDDPRLTRALRLLLDHDEFKTAWAEVWYGKGRYSAVFAAATADTWDLTEDEYRNYLEWKQPKDDAIKESLSLLSAAGYSKDSPLKFTISGSSTNAYQSAMVQLAQAQFKRNGRGVVEPDVKLFGTTEWDAVRANGTFEYYVGGHNAGGVDPDAYFTSTYKTGGGRNYGKLSDPQLDAMIAEQRTIFDEPRRKKAVRDIVLYLIDHSPYGSVAADYVLNATALKVHDLPAEGTGVRMGEHYENAWVAA